MAKSLNVLVLAQYFSPDMGGGSTRATNVVKGLLKNNCNVTVVAAFPNYPHGKIPEQYKHKPIVPEKFGTAQVYRVWIPALPHSNITNRIILHLCFIVSSMFAFPFVSKTDVVWGANPNLFSFFPSFIYGLFKRVPTVRNVDDLWPEVFYELGYVKSVYAQKILDFLAWISYLVPAAITPISIGYKRKIVSKYNISPQKIHVIEVGIDIEKKLVATNLSKNSFVIMYSGVLGLGYNFDVLLDAAQLLSKNKEIVFVIRGIGEMASKLKKNISERNLKNVFLNNRFLTASELDAVLSSADVFVLPMANMSFIDSGLPTKIFEYQAYGKPTICVSNGESARYVAYTKSGLIVKHGDYQALAASILELQKSTELATALGKNGRKYVEENVSIHAVGLKMNTLFNSLMEPLYE